MAYLEVVVWEMQNERPENISRLHGIIELVDGVGVNRPLRVAVQNELHLSHIGCDSLLRLQGFGR